MNIYYRPSLLSDLKDKNLFLDNNVLIGCLAVTELLALITEFKQNGCALLSINSVFFEFTRGGGNIEGFNSRADFFDSLVSIWPVEKQLEDLEEVIVTLHNVAPNMSYTDFLLAAATYKFGYKAAKNILKEEM